MRPTSALILSGLTLGALGVVASCGGDADIAVPPEGGAGGANPDASIDGGGGTAGFIDFDGGGGTAQNDGCVGDACGSDAGPACGDGAIDPGEVCDDGNGESGDGCGANCDAIEQGYACPTPGEACVSTVICGDAKITGNETCDDQNQSAGDGCDASCQLEAGWTCPVVGAACVAAECGDGIIAGSEECEDDNATPTSGDGCDDTCRLEVGWVCRQPGQACEPTTCGDGVAEGSEQCDDGNNDMGDGCTPFCVREPDCTAGSCTSTCGDGIKLPNDNEECEDGNTRPGDGCSPTCQIEPGFVCQDVGQNVTELVLPIVLRDFRDSHPDFEDVIAADLGIVTADLGPNGKPVYANPGGTTTTTHGEAAFDQWYVDVPTVNQTVLQTLTLGQLPTGEFQYANGNFFPLDGLGFGNQGRNHNFHFTSEVRYWFEYKGGEQLDFTGDDDVFVFVNRKLAVDLGGVHGAQNGSVTLDTAAATQFNLQLGSIYEIVVFQAERHTTQSNYRLTLSDFVNVTSSCDSVCGDGIVTPDEVCDDGVNDGSYGSCMPDCTLGPHCGDGVVQDAEGEDCDDGVNLTPYGTTGCAPGCKTPATCGDGQVDSIFGEACDDGTNDGGYGECAANCVLGPYCGDGIVQSEHETCDDGNRQGGDGCDGNCQLDVPR